MILVTGGAGFIGSNFVLEWFKDPATSNEKVLNLDALTYVGNRENLASLEGDSRHVFLQGDICDRALIDRLLAEHQPTPIVRFAVTKFVSLKSSKSLQKI